MTILITIRISITIFNILLITVVNHSQVNGGGGGVQCELIVQVDLFPTQVAEQLGPILDVGGGQRSQSPVKSSLNPRQMARYKVSHSSTIRAGNRCRIKATTGDHTSVKHPHKGVIRSHSNKLASAG